MLFGYPSLVTIPFRMTLSCQVAFISANLTLSHGRIFLLHNCSDHLHRLREFILSRRSPAASKTHITVESHSACGMLYTLQTPTFHRGGALAECMMNTDGMYTCRNALDNRTCLSLCLHVLDGVVWFSCSVV